MLSPVFILPFFRPLPVVDVAQHDRNHGHPEREQRALALQVSMFKSRSIVVGEQIKNQNPKFEILEYSHEN